MPESKIPCLSFRRAEVRKGSHKNILQVNGKPLINYTLDAARAVTDDAHICVSTDDCTIRALVEAQGLPVPFLRPAYLATDTAGSQDVMLHALDYFQDVLHRPYDRVCLLQPTSPLRTAKHIYEALALWEDSLDMVVSVTKSPLNPYFNLFEETSNGWLALSKTGHYLRRQDAPTVWAYNGAIYLINQASLKATHMAAFKCIKKYVMDEESSQDVDTWLDLECVKAILAKRAKELLTLE
jgi:N-acylneuraminate cytidylyltransferase